MVRGSYFLGWLCFLGAVILRILSFSRDLASRMQEVNILPRNFLALSFLFFVMTLASEAYQRSQPKGS